MRPGVWVFGVTEAGLHMLQHCAAPKATLPGPARAHYSGDIIGVLGCGQGCAGAMFWGAILGS